MPGGIFSRPAFGERRHRFTTPELVAQAISRSMSDTQKALSDVQNKLAGHGGETDIQQAVSSLLAKRTKIGVFCNSHGNFFMQEIANMVHWQLEDLQVNSQLCSEESDLREPFDIRIFVAPHEFFSARSRKFWKDLTVNPSSVLYNVEQIQTNWFCRGFPFLLQAPLVFDINFQSAVLLRKMGCKAIHYMPPYLEGSKYVSSQLDVSNIELFERLSIFTNAFRLARARIHGSADRHIVRWNGVRTEGKDNGKPPGLDRQVPVSLRLYASGCALNWPKLPNYIA